MPVIDWTAGMQQTFEYYIVDPGTWKDSKRITDKIISSSITRDNSSETLGSASIEAVDLLGEYYVRIYLMAIQNGVSYKVCLGTYLVQTPSSSFNGKIKSVSIDAYTSLLEMKEKSPPLGYSILKDENIMERAYQIVRENVRAPVTKAVSDKTLYNDFVSNLNDTWLTFTTDLIANAKYSFINDEYGQILFAPYQDTASLQPVWTYNDDNSSILYPEISLDHDMYGIPNVVEVIYSYGNEYYQARAVNDDENSPLSTVNRGREILHRISDPDLVGIPTKLQLQEYAEQQLRDLSTVEYTVSYTHAYCPVRVGDCVRLNYEKAGIEGVKAKVISQSIKCEPGCPVTEKAVYTTKLWGDFL